MFFSTFLSLFQDEPTCSDSNMFPASQKIGHPLKLSNVGLHGAASVLAWIATPIPCWPCVSSATMLEKREKPFSGLSHQIYRSSYHRAQEQKVTLVTLPCVFKHSTCLPETQIPRKLSKVNHSTATSVDLLKAAPCIPDLRAIFPSSASRP